MFNLCAGISVLYLIIFVQRSNTLAFSDSIDEEIDDSDWEKRSSKLKYGELEHTHLDDDYVKGSIWPKPQEEIKENANFSINPEVFNFTTSGNGEHSNILKSAIERYKELTFPKSGLKSVDLNTITSLNIHVKKKREELGFGMDEGCESFFLFLHKILCHQCVPSVVDSLSIVCNSNCVIQRTTRPIIYIDLKKKLQQFKHFGYSL